MTTHGLDGPMNGACFLAYVQQVLAPNLKLGDVVIMDNLASHESAPAQDAIEAVGARLMSLPPHIPDLNPIENAFAKREALLLKPLARSIDLVWDASPASFRPTNPAIATATSTPLDTMQTKRKML
nr:transposase [Brevundimonas sp.]